MADFPDFFDRLPDPIILIILSHICDIKTLLRCRSLSRRFNSLVPQTDSLLLRVDRVISAGGDDSFLTTIINSLLHLISFSPEHESLDPPHNSPSRILRSFDAVKNLRIELPAGDLRLEKGANIKWVARFGKTLRSCVIFAFTNGSDPGRESPGAGLKMRVIWTISALIAASARHFMVADVINEQKSLSHLVVNDREDEGTVVMDKDGLREFRESYGGGSGEGDGGGWWGNKNRTTVPAVGMRMRHEARLELSGGVVMEGATLVVVRPVGVEVEEHGGDEGLAAEAFGKDGGVYGEAVERLLRSRSYIIQMNSF